MARRGGRLALRLVVAVLLSGVVQQAVEAFYLPGVAPHDFSKREKVVIKVNKLSSTKNLLPYEYYSLPYCQPESKDLKATSENLGEVLRGDRILTSPYEVQMAYDEQCKVVCRKKLTGQESKDFKAKIKDSYRVNMILDNLPVAVYYYAEESGRKVKLYERGFPVGFKQADKAGGEDSYYLYNHLKFTILHHKDPKTLKSRIVGFEVQPFSVQHKYDGDFDPEDLNTCNQRKMVAVSDQMAPQPVDEEQEVIFTYSVLYQESSIPWASRWDTYLMMVDDQIHWFSIINSLMIVLFLSGMVAMIMLRTLHRDIAAYNEMQSAEEAMEETGWKLVHGDVFRPPANASLLSTYVGVGSQILGMTVVTMTFALLGFLSPANRGALMTAMVLLFAFMGVVAGYYSARLYKSLKGTAWKSMTLKTAFMFPGIVFCIFFILNLFIWAKKSSGAVPFGTLFALICLWFGISAPLVFVGSYYGFKKPAFDFPVRTNKIPRQIPEQSWYMQPLVSCLIGGILPFGAVFIELFFILSSIWLHQFYYLFGFLFLVFVILVVTCAEISVVLCYFQLCGEDYHWWWRAYCTSGTSAVYLFLYAVYYYTKLEVTKFVPTMVYFGYMAVISYGFFCLTGTVGFYSCLWFVRKIYGAVKFD